MIVRISNEGQYRLDDALQRSSTSSTTRSSGPSTATTRTATTSAFEELLRFVRDEGTPLDGDDLEGSEFILPPADISFVEAGAGHFEGEGLIPDCAGLGGGRSPGAAAGRRARPARGPPAAGGCPSRRPAEPGRPGGTARRRRGARAAVDDDRARPRRTT